jgi:hypothetical protein
LLAATENLGFPTGADLENRRLMRDVAEVADDDIFESWNGRAEPGLQPTPVNVANVLERRSSRH